MDTPHPSDPPPELALEMSGVTVGSLADPDIAVLEGVNWKVAVGDYWLIGGLQGSGKSDLLATAAGIMAPLHGLLRVFGQELGAGFEHQLVATRLRLGLVFDGGRLLNHLSVCENVALPLRYHQNLSLPEVEEQARALLEFVELAEFANRAPGSMHPNVRQRVGLARALALRPEVLLLDNPLSGLDPKDSTWWLELIEQLCEGHPILDRRRLTLVVTDDNLHPWRNRARQFAVLANSRLLLIGGRPELASSTDPSVRELFHPDSITA